MLHGQYLKHILSKVCREGVRDDGAGKNKLLIPAILCKLAASVYKCDNAASNLHRQLHGPQEQASVVHVG